LTVVDLSNDWAPQLFTEAPDLGKAGRQPYRKIYLALSDEQEMVDRPWLQNERFLELYGISPTFRVVLQRLAEEHRHRCHDAVDDWALEELSQPLRPTPRQGPSLRSTVARARQARRRLVRLASRRGLTTIDALAQDERHASLWARYERGRIPLESIRALQTHLRCDGLLPRGARHGVFDHATLAALRRWQERHMIVSPGTLDTQSRRVLLLDSRRADFQGALRSLRERVVDATGLIEDGSASQQWGQIMDTFVDGDTFRKAAGSPPMPRAAPDLVARATEAAARALGWTGPGAMVRFFLRLDRTGEGPQVALPLPAPPAYHKAHMDLRAEIDRGDVYYEFRDRRRSVGRRPTLTLYARTARGEVPLLRWSTTIGGWQQQNTGDGGIGLRYQNSPTGPRVWRHIFATPTWLPPESTPDEELLVKVQGEWVPNLDLFGPSYRSAYGLVSIIHHKRGSARSRERGLLRDEGIRTHGSARYRSIQRGHSHGCHRLYNHLAVRLAGFLLRHRNHRRHGSREVGYEREIELPGGTIALGLASRGYLYELTPPVPIEVLEGRIRGRLREPEEEFHLVRSAD
jgi:hypothetical protein